ncbi:hypothetical protein RND81_11G213500 [Saponaria officinalis]|uniref:DOG1 domain-containing protein n=1 Tax=Saponaria officinalis TaxID=3572 RepID=A0AAW1HRC7_SAPOF
MSANSNTSHTNKTSVPSSCKNFNEFFNSWLERQQAYLDKLVEASSFESRDEKRELVEKVLLHYEEYYEEKYKVISQDIFQLFSPPWLNTFEMAILWIDGLFKPPSTDWS